MKDNFKKLRKFLEDPELWFFLAIISWVSLIIVPLTVGLNTIAAAVMAAGAPLLYYFYQESVNQPLVDTLETKKGEMNYTKFLISGPIRKDPETETNIPLVFPVIHAHTTLKNRGKATAKECFGRLRTGEGDSFGRWSGLNEEATDLHPGLEHRLVFMRFFRQVKYYRN